MNDQEGLILFFAFVGLIIFSRIAAHFLDKGRIKEAAAYKGWSNVEVHWEPFARGFLTETKERFYFVAFKDKQGRSHSLHCKTSMLMGVSWIDESVKGI